MSRQKRIAVIGGGPSGLTASKTCKEEGLDVVCFERNGVLGGLWRYHDEDIEGVASVMKTTIINTSKEMSAFSDFPPPADFPNYMHNSMMFKYFQMYAEKFDLLDCIRYHREVMKIEPSKSFDETGKWIVTTRHTKDNTETQEEFDGVMVCIGHHVFPKIPTFPGQEKFKGTITHTHSLKSCEAYNDKRVMVVGIGNSGVDAAVDSTFVAKKVYLSTRRGSWIFGRVGKKGNPFDIDFSTRLNYLFYSLRSYEAMCTDIEKELDKKFDHTAYNLRPKHRVLSAHPTMNDALPNCILSGRVVVKGDIERFEESGVVFQGETQVTEIDDVILATGYHIRFPFLGDDILKTENNRIQLYKYVIPPQLKHQTLAIIALAQPIGAIFPLAEMQSRWFMQIFNKKLSLPNKEAILEDIDRKNVANAKRYVESTRHTIQVDWIPYLDELAAEIGAKPDLLKMAVTDPQLFWTCLTGPCFPYQYRLQGPHIWSGARNAIVSYKERITTPLNTRYGKVESKEIQPRPFQFAWLFYFVVIAALLWKFFA